VGCAGLVFLGVVVLSEFELDSGKSERLLGGGFGMAGVGGNVLGVFGDLRVERVGAVGGRAISSAHLIVARCAVACGGLARLAIWMGLGWRGRDYSRCWAVSGAFWSDWFWGRNGKAPRSGMGNSDGGSKGVVSCLFSVS
jgi:hypothetical protein